MSKPINYKCQLNTDANCKLLMHMNEASWNGTPDEVKDASGCGNHGVAGGGVTTIAGGKFGSCGSFDGINDYVAIPDSTSLDITDAITLEAWVKSSGKDGTVRRIVRKSGLYFLQEQNNNIYFFVSLDGVGQQSASINSTHWNVEVWNHIVGTYDKDAGANNLKIYLNGVLKNSNTYTEAITTDNAMLSIGSYNGTAGFFKGSIDEVAIYSRAKTAEEIYQHYHAQIGMHII